MTQIRKPVAVAVAIAVGLGSLVACGENGGDEGGSAREENASKQEFIAEADAICAEANQRREAIRQDAAGIHAKRVRPVFLGALERLKALEPPRGDEKTISAMLMNFERAFARIDVVVAAKRARNGQEDHAAVDRAEGAWTELAVAGQNIAHKHGLKECSRFGTP